MDRRQPLYRLRYSSLILGSFLLVYPLQAEIPAPSYIWERPYEAPATFNTGKGHAGSRGWELDYKRDTPGYVLAGLKDPWLLEPGAYRATFNLRRGHYPSKGFLHKTYTLFRIELWDLNTKKLINSRELQVADFPTPNRYEQRWMEFSMHGREGHKIEPRGYWNGLANGEIASIDLIRFRAPDMNGMEQKALILGDEMERHHLENGFVVSRKPNGDADETGDATTYTGFYVASLAWKYAVTKDELTYQAMENGLTALHNAVKGTPDYPIITRFVEADGTPFPKSPSKDVYTSFFFAHAIAAPFIKNLSLKKRMARDIDNIGQRFLKDDLRIEGGNGPLMSLTPYYTEEELRSGISKLVANKKNHRKFVKNLKTAQSIVPFGEIWPGFKLTLKAIEKGDEQQIFEQAVPALNGAALVLERARNILREQYRVDLFPRRKRNQDYPGIQLEKVLTKILKQLPPVANGKRFTRISQLQVLASNTLIVLHMMKTGQVLTTTEAFDDYYKTNLYKQDALLKTALDWYGLEEDLFRLTAGNPTADRERRGYLSALALYNLIRHEKNSEIKNHYQEILDRWWVYYRNEDNPMAAAFELIVGEKKKADLGLVLKALDEYPIDRKGFGAAYWARYSNEVGEKYGGGADGEFSREALPVALRPKDSFLWQRNARRLKGDSENIYPATDFLFVYWLCRYHGLIPAPEARPTVKK